MGMVVDTSEPARPAESVNNFGQRSLYYDITVLSINLLRIIHVCIHAHRWIDTQEARRHLAGKDLVKTGIEQRFDGPFTYYHLFMYEDGINLWKFMGPRTNCSCDGPLLAFSLVVRKQYQDPPSYSRVSWVIPVFLEQTARLIVTLAQQNPGEVAGSQSWLVSMPGNLRSKPSESRPEQSLVSRLGSSVPVENLVCRTTIESSHRFMVHSGSHFQWLVASDSRQSELMIHLGISGTTTMPKYPIKLNNYSCWYQYQDEEEEEECSR